MTIEKTSSGQALKPRTSSKRASKPAATAKPADKPADKPASVQRDEAMALGYGLVRKYVAVAHRQAAYQEVLDTIDKPADKPALSVRVEPMAGAGAVTVTASSGHVARLQELRVRWSAATKRAAAKRASARKATERVAYWRAQIDAYDALGLDAWRGSPATA